MSPGSDDDVTAVYVGHTDIRPLINTLNMFITLTGVSRTRHLWCGQGRASCYLEVRSLNVTVYLCREAKF